MGVPFYKMAGSGNDFIIVDNRKGVISGDLSARARLLCRDRFSIGANGLILLNSSKVADFSWRLFNADGSEAEMCGNGARCVVRYANDIGLVGDIMTFETVAGILKGYIENDGSIKIQLTEPFDLRQAIALELAGGKCEFDVVNTGVPHAVGVVSGKIESYDIKTIGKEVRYHPEFAPDGVNVNLAEVIDRHTLKVRTYERGVEDETMACGTGAVASALICVLKGLVDFPVNVKPTGGKVLKVDMVKDSDGEFYYLAGDALIVGKGEIMPEAFEE